MSLKTSVVADFDSRRILFHKVVDALDLLPSADAWDLTWGEPFLALSRDRKLWVRVFYEESLPITLERLRAEAERLKPHVMQDGQLVLCVPEVWARGLSSAAMQETGFPVRIWSYDCRVSGNVATRELRPGSAQDKVLPAPAAVLSQETLSEEKLSSDEIRELTEIGVELKRYALKKAG